MLNLIADYKVTIKAKCKSYKCKPRNNIRFRFQRALNHTRCKIIRDIENYNVSNDSYHVYLHGIRNHFNLFISLQRFILFIYVNCEINNNGIRLILYLLHHAFNIQLTSYCLDTRSHFTLDTSKN